MTSVEPATLAAHELFADLPAPQLARLAAAMHYEKMPLKSEFVREGQRSNKVYLLLSGLAKVRCEGQGAHGSIINVVRPGELIGEIAALGGECHSASVTAWEISTAASMSADFFKEFCLSEGQFQHNVLCLNGRRAKAAAALQGMLSGRQTSERLAVRLTDLARRSCGHGRPLAPDYEIPAALTYNDLRDLAEASETQTTKAIKLFRNLKWIEITANRHVVLKQPQALERHYMSRSILSAGDKL